MHQWLVRQGRALAVGLGLTALALIVHRSGLTDRREWEAFDFHVRHFSRIASSDRIVHIDVDDAALDRIGSWPWPRDVQADLIRILGELGARQVVMDIVWSEPRPAEIRDPNLDRFTDIEGETEQLGHVSEANRVYPDDELEGAIRAAGNAYLAMYCELESQTSATDELGERISALLLEQFDLDATALAERLGSDADTIEPRLARLKRRTAETLVTNFLAAHPEASFREVHDALLDTPFERLTADREDLKAAYHRALGLRALRDRCPPVPENLRGRLPRVDRVVPPVYKFTSAAHRVGFVTFSPDRDGRTRRVPLLLEWDGRLLEQLGFAAARDILGIAVEDLSLDAMGNLHLAARDDRPAACIQLDERGQILINWHVRKTGWQDCFTHYPAALLLRICDGRRNMRDNRTRILWTIAEALRLVKGEQGFELYRQQINRLLESERRLHWATLQGRGEAPDVVKQREETARLRREIERDHTDTMELVREEWRALQQEPDPNDPAIADDYRTFSRAHDLISRDLAELKAANERLADEDRRLLEQLRPLIEGRICMVGYTATALADMVSTPPYGRVPGVLVHTNLLNSLLQGSFRRWALPTTQLAMIAFIGVGITLLTTTVGPKVSFSVVLAGSVGGLALNGYLLFARLSYWGGFVTALSLAFIIWALIVLLRYLTEEREKRRFSRAVAQYVSPAMARQIAESSVRLDLSPVATRVTCFFSDIVQFTPMSERLGPEGTKTVLNPYLEAMSSVLHHRQAMINKFMGDGIFAFFNPPILPCPEHEVAACETALDSFAALDELKARMAGHPLAAEFGRLNMRIGMASGTVFVGDYGSENKLDYTCVGDTVNLAARLESANKVFGTAIMLTGPTQEVVGERFLYRPLGALQVRGQSMALPVYELLGRPGEVSDDRLRYSDTFGEAVAAFVLRDWQHATAAFQQCLAANPADPGAHLYLRTIEHYQLQPPPEDWSGNLELTEK